MIFAMNHQYHHHHSIPDQYSDLKVVFIQTSFIILFLINIYNFKSIFKFDEKFDSGKSSN